MRTYLFVPLALFGTAMACTDQVPDDPGARIFPVARFG